MSSAESFTEHANLEKKNKRKQTTMCRLLNVLPGKLSVN